MDASSNRSTVSPRRAVVAATLGNALEWFDLVIYGFFASVIASQFFPASDPAISLLMALGTFGGAFFVRPIGAIMIGSYADKVGRKSALLLTMVLMMTGTLMIAITPSYETIGVLAPVIVILARLIQGFSAGGEFASATTFLAEQIPDKRAFYSSWQFASQGLTMLLAAAFGVVLTSTLSPEQLAAWGWRIPFLFGLIIGPVALYIRRGIDETQEFRDSVHVASPFAEAMQAQKKNMLYGLGVVILATVAMYLLLYMPTYATETLKLTGISGFATNLAVGVGLICLTPLSGYSSDKWGRVIIALPASAMLAVISGPLFYWLTYAPSAASLLVVQCLLTVFVSIYLGTVPALLTDLFPPHVRTTSMSLSYNLAVMTFGGLAPFIITWIITKLDIVQAPGLYLAVAALISFATLVAARRDGVR